MEYTLTACPIFWDHLKGQEIVGVTSDLETVIREALEDARAAGKDHLTQTEEAVRAVLKVRPDMTAPEALTAVRRIQQA